MRRLFGILSTIYLKYFVILINDFNLFQYLYSFGSMSIYEDITILLCMLTFKVFSLYFTHQKCWGHAPYPRAILQDAVQRKTAIKIMNNPINFNMKIPECIQNLLFSRAEAPIP